MALVRALNKMTKAGMPEACVLPENTTRYGGDLPEIYLFNKAHLIWKVEGDLSQFCCSSLASCAYS